MGDRRAVIACFAVLCIGIAPPLLAQDSAAVSMPTRARWGSEFMIPFGSMIIPGMGQYIDGAPLSGAAYTGTAIAGFMVAAKTSSTDLTNSSGLPRTARAQLQYTGAHVMQTSGFLSAWDSFHRAVPALQQDGKYEFLTARESVGDLLSAPFDTEFLSRGTTWLNLAYTGLVAGLVVSGRSPGVEYEPFRAHDVAFTASLSLNAGVGEEALFRGWLLPMLHQKTGQRFWLANTLQAGTFGAMHPNAGGFAVVIAGWALYEGWLTRRNDWSVRESIFHHFWYDVAVVIATFLADERGARVQLTFPTIRF